jgi:hypothetical protein
VYAADTQEPWEYGWVGFNGACANKLAAQLPFTDVAPIHHARDAAALERRARPQIYEARGLEPQDEASMVGYLYLFIAALMRETRESEPHSASSSSQYVLSAIKYIQFNYSHDISINDVAKKRGRFAQPSVPRIHEQRGQKPHRLPDRIPHQRGLQPAAQLRASRSRRSPSRWGSLTSSISQARFLKRRSACRRANI